jgi:hypothetical protein
LQIPSKVQKKYNSLIENININDIPKLNKAFIFAYNKYGEEKKLN